MVKFSDLKNDPQSSSNRGQQEGRGELSKGSRLSFSQLDRTREGIISERISHEKINRAEDWKAIYEKATAYLEEVFDAVRKRQRFSLETGIQIVQEIVTDQTPKNPLLLKAIHGDDPEKFLVNNCVNVAIFAIKMAQQLEFTSERQVEIGLAALLHEIGMGVIPENLIYKKEKLTEREIEIFKKRTEFGHKILNEFGREYSFLAETILQICERIDGSGYPAGLRGDEIGEYAQIIGVADMYEALTHSRPQRDKFLYFAAVKEIIKTGKKGFQKKYIKALLNICSIFPVDSYVKLNSNATGRVIETYPEQPMKPKLQVVYDSQGRRVRTERIVDLNDNSILFIVDSVPKEYLRKLARGVTEAQRPYEIRAKDPEPLPALDEELAIGAEKESAPSDNKELPDWVQEADEPLSMGDLSEEPGTGQIVKKEKFYTQIRKSIRLKLLLIAAALIALIGCLFWLYSSKDRLKPDSVGSKPGLSPAGNPRVKNKVAPVNKAGLYKAPAGPILPENVAPPVAKPVAGIDQQSGRRPPTSNNSKLSGKAANEAPESPLTVTAQKKAAPEETHQKISESKIQAPAYPYSIKLTSHRSRSEAEVVLPRYAEKGLTAYWVKVDLGSLGTWYRVFAGHYDSIEQAEKLINTINLKEASVKKTRYAALIGAFTSEESLKEKVGLLSQRGFSPYVIKNKSGGYHLYVGAFYTHKGAQDQYAELKMSGIQNQIVER